MRCAKSFERHAFGWWCSHWLLYRFGRSWGRHNSCQSASDISVASHLMSWQHESIQHHCQRCTPSQLPVLYVWALSSWGTSQQNGSAHGAGPAIGGAFRLHHFMHPPTEFALFHGRCRWVVSRSRSPGRFSSWVLLPECVQFCILAETFHPVGCGFCCSADVYGHWQRQLLCRYQLLTSFHTLDSHHDSVSEDWVCHTVTESTWFSKGPQFCDEGVNGFVFKLVARVKDIYIVAFIGFIQVSNYHMFHLFEYCSNILSHPSEIELIIHL